MHLTGKADARQTREGVCPVPPYPRDRLLNAVRPVSRVLLAP